VTSPPQPPLDSPLRPPRLTVVHPDLDDEPAVLHERGPRPIAATHTPDPHPVTDQVEAAVNRHPSAHARRRYDEILAAAAESIARDPDPWGPGR
jgi:hypothetical protein